MSKIITTSSFIKRIKDIYGNHLDFSEVEYRGMQNKVKVSCNDHGPFWQYAKHMVRGISCPKCGKIKKGVSKSKSSVSNKLKDFMVDNLPENSRAIPLTKGECAIVDEEDYERVMMISWHVIGDKHKYARGKEGLMHHFILGDPGVNMTYDHINGNGLDNRRCNLRLCTQQENNMNTKPKGGLSKYKGVTYDGANKKWISQLMINRKHVHRKTHDTEEEAARAYDEAAKKYFNKDFAYLNFPEEVH